ncbi:hypothetical protein L596_005097 [Steinernema carpocapsae]|uniref:Uncharacterized protein n=1 Tax=Steinernema carpocapsae TaxID=34508 RepID=A0A4U8UZE7_STECR|nr:hypothetical protein L596_005097 [Steinernema carpocapsae]
MEKDILRLAQVLLEHSEHQEFSRSIRGSLLFQTFHPQVTQHFQRQTEEKLATNYYSRFCSNTAIERSDFSFIGFRIFGRDFYLRCTNLGGLFKQ